MKTRCSSPSRGYAFAGRARHRRLAGDATRNLPRRSSAFPLALAGLTVAILASCSPPAQTPTGPAAEFAAARDNFAKGQNASYDKALDALEALGDANPPNAYTDRARVLRAVIVAGKIEADLKLSEAYAKGAAVTRNDVARSADSRLRLDSQQAGAELALRLGQVVMDLTKGGTLPRNLSLDAPYPSPDPPATIAALEKMKEGLPVGPEDLTQASLDAQHIAIADALAEVLHGDRDNAKSKLSAGPVPLNNAEFALFLTKEVMAGASLYDKKHLDDPTRFKLMAGVADGAAKAGAAALAGSPDAGQAKRLKKLQDQIKAGIKAS
ncbi:MAG TPA: hypothetical protein VL523_09220 [Terriglobia bacterium]|nr:hypothetical protein [Terriglobia bacterium]